MIRQHSEINSNSTFLPSGTPSPPIPKLPPCAQTDDGCCWDNNAIA